jgi:hypothetical protein
MTSSLPFRSRSNSEDWNDPAASHTKEYIDKLDAECHKMSKLFPDFYAALNAWDNSAFIGNAPHKDAWETNSD